MKLYLSSYQIGDRSAELSGFFGQNKKVAVIANARDYSTDLERRSLSLTRDMAQISGVGLEPIELDLRGYFGRAAELEQNLTEFGGVWVVGGNSFILRKAMAYSGLDELVKKLIPTDFVYGGYSAGVCVLSPTLRGIELCDQPEAEADGYRSEIIWDGLGLIPYSVAPHYRSDHPESAMIEKVVEYFIQHDMPYRALRDGEVIIERC